MRSLLLVVFVGFVLPACDQKNPPPLDKGYGPVIISGGALEFSTTNQKLKFNSFSGKVIPGSAVLRFPFLMNSETTFRLLSTQFYYQCRELNAIRCSAWLNFQILDSSSNEILFDRVKTNKDYVLPPDKSYVLQIDLQTAVNEQNYFLNFSVWKGNGEPPMAELTCETSRGTLSISGSGVTNSQAPYLSKNVVCGIKTSTNFKIVHLFEAGPSVNYSNIFAYDQKEIADPSRETYEVRVDLESKGAGTFTCGKYLGVDEFPTALETREIRNCENYARPIPKN